MCVCARAYVVYRVCVNIAPSISYCCNDLFTLLQRLVHILSTILGCPLLVHLRVATACAIILCSRPFLFGCRLGCVFFESSHMLTLFTRTTRLTALASGPTRSLRRASSQLVHAPSRKEGGSGRAMLRTGTLSTRLRPNASPPRCKIESIIYIYIYIYTYMMVCRQNLFRVRCCNCKTNCSRTSPILPISDVATCTAHTHACTHTCAYTGQLESAAQRLGPKRLLALPTHPKSTSLLPEGKAVAAS